MSFKYKELGECIDLIIDNRGKTPKKMGSDWVEKGIKTISAKNVHNGKLDNYESIRFVNSEVYKKWMKDDIKKGDCLLVSEGATLGENLYWDLDEKVVIGQRLYCIRTNEEILNSKYFSAYLNTVEYQKEIEGRSTGTSVLGIRQTELLKTKVLIMDMEEQKFIGNLYYDINLKIEVNNKINKNLEEMAQAIFKQWFVDFEFPNEEGKPYKSSGGEMVESELGMIPKGFKISELKEIADDIITGKTPSTKNKENYGEKYPFITIPDMHNSIFINSSERYLSEKGSETQKSKLLPKNSIIVSCIATVGLVSITTKESHINQQINAVIIDKIEYLYYLYEAIKRKKELLLAIGSSGSATLNVNKKEFEKIKYLNPTNYYVNLFNSKVNILYEKIKANILENERLEKLRDTLLPKLMSGEIRVPLENNEN